MASEDPLRAIQTRCSGDVLMAAHSPQRATSGHDELAGRVHQAISHTKPHPLLSVITHNAVVLCDKPLRPVGRITLKYEALISLIVRLTQIQTHSFLSAANDPEGTVRGFEEFRAVPG